MGWELATEKVKTIAKKNGDLRIFWGSGQYDEPCVVASTKDSWSGEGQGYNVMVYPNGNGYMEPYKYFDVPI